jgi:multiple sugar transport system substrate-binding protein
MTAYAQAGGIPAMPAVLKSQASINPAFSQVADSLAKYGYSEPNFAQSFPAYSKLAQDLSGAWVGQTSVDSAVKQANTDLQQLIDASK